MAIAPSTDNPSLLKPADTPDGPDTWLSKEVIKDLGLEAIILAMCPQAPHRELIESILYRLCDNPNVIIYRQAVLADLLRQPALMESLEAIVPLLDELAVVRTHQPSAATSLEDITERAGELALLVECIQRLSAAFASSGDTIESAGLKALRSYVAVCAADERFQQMADALPRILAELRTSASITIGVNLDHLLRPEEAVLLSVNPTRFTESGLLDRLLGKGAAHGRGIAPLHTLPMISESGGLIGGSGAALPGPVRRAEPMMVPLFRDLSRVLERITRPIAEELYAYGSISGRPLANLRPDVIFYVYAVNLIRKLAAAGLRMCRPTIAPADERVCEVEAAYNLQLALHLLGQTRGRALAELVVSNDIILGPRGRIVILTGPNQGGKTTYLQAVGHVQIFAQAGLFVPGQHACVSPIDAVATHFPIEEHLELGTGRFGDEARRIRAIFERVTRHSLVLLNESFSTTSAGESVYLARDVVRVLRRIGLRALFATHLHDLATGIDVLNRETPGDSDVVSMVASYAEADQHLSYRIVPGPPSGRSYAERIAARYGISLEQLVELLCAREILRRDTPLDS